MIFDPKWSAFKVLAAAIKSEIDAAAFYSRLLKKVREKTLKEKIKFLAYEEKKHQRILERLFSQRYAGHKLVVPGKSPIPFLSWHQVKNLAVLELFRRAMDAEKMAEEFYRKAQKKMDDKESQRILQYLSRVERSHYFLIMSEMDILKHFPDSYNADDFHLGLEMIHIGP